MINYGILSTARITNRFVEGIRNSKEGNVYAIASRSLEKAKAKAEELNIDKYYGSYNELLEDDNVDVVYIPTTNDTHYLCALEALKHKKHVVLEKPFTLNPEHSKELFEVAKANNVFLMEGQKAVFLPVTQKVKQLLDDKVIGEVQYVVTSMSHPARHPKGNWMYDLSKGGGALNGSGSYPLEYCFYLLNNTNYTVNATFVKGIESADNLVSFQLGTVDYIINGTISMDVVLPNHAIFYGSKGNIKIENFWKADKLILTVDGNSETFNFPFVSEFAYEVDHVNECIKNGMLTSDMMTKEITIASTEMIQSMYQSYELKRL